ncbi:LysR family transcriptional regulator [Neorhizobium sp. DT-125]|uniref:LysR family transcriptional regulator n=1 Tax=Neorhizobium sp. DT-125 TaxID=3396163 RepID=UPI003F1BF55D
MITFKQLEAFFWVAELGGVNEAADRLGATQSAVSKRVQDLEYALQLELFDRTKRRVQLTHDGRRMLKHTAEILHHRTRLLDDAKAAPTVRSLRLGVTELTATTWLPALVSRIRNSHPSVTVEPVVEASAALVEKLRVADLDMAVVPDAFRTPEFEIITLAAVEFSWLCSPIYAPHLSRIPLSALKDYTIIAQRHGSGLGDLIVRWLDSNHVSLGSAISTSSLAAQTSLTLSGLGISYLPRKASEGLIANGALKPIETSPPLPKIPYCVMYPKGKADDFLRFVMAIASEICDFGRLATATQGVD